MRAYLLPPSFVREHQTAVWSLADLADDLAAGLERLNRDLDREQAVYGLDALEETAMHPVLADILQQRGYGVTRESRYPSGRAASHGRSRLSAGDRCDLVVTPDGRPLRCEKAAMTLFEPEDAVPLDEALWVEVKLVCQFTEDGPNSRYASQMLSVTRRDVVKLAADPRIVHAAVLLIQFCTAGDIAEHDLGMWYEECLRRDLPVSYPVRRVIPVTDRRGHGVMLLSLSGVGRMCES